MTRNHKVPPEGPLDARIMILGESPGKNEWAKGRPFIGWSGDLLNDVLSASGKRRGDIYITNVIKDALPPGGGNKKQKANKRAFFFEGPHPTKVYMDGIICVKEEIEQVKPNVVFTLGNYALWTMMQHEGIMKWRGSILESSLVPGQKIIPSLHPAFFINARTMWHLLPLLEWDFARAVRESEYPEIRRPDYKFTIDPSPADLARWETLLLQQEIISCDTEWYAPNKLAYVGYAIDELEAITVPNNTMERQRFNRRILSSGVPIIFQNGMFDIVALHRQGFEVANMAEDTMVAFNSCWASLKAKSLEIQTSILTDQPYYKDELDFVGQDEERGQIYCCTDCVVTYKSWVAMRDEEFKITGGRRGYDISMSAAPYFLEASKVGIRVDEERRNELKDLHLEKADEIENALSQALGYTINCRSSQQVTALVHDWLIPAYGLKKAKRNSRQDNLMTIAATAEVPEAQMILESIIRVRQNRNIVSRYLHDGIVDIDGRVRTTWNLAGTRSGRFSTTIPWWPGLAFQTVPSDARVIFIPDPGHVFVGFDYEQAEARVVAVLTYNHELLEDMAAGIDIHTKLASQLPFGMTYDELLADIAKEIAAGGDKDDCRPRYVSKKSRHAFNYVEGAYTFSITLNREWLDTRIGVTVEEAEKIRRQYLELNPGLETWWENVKQRMKQQHYLENSFGRRRMFPGMITEDLIREGVSYEPQSTISDLCTQSIVKICKAAPYAQVYAHMHDGGLFQVPEEELPNFYPLMMEHAEWPIRVGKEMITIPVEGKVGTSWGEMGSYHP